MKCHSFVFTTGPSSLVALLVRSCLLSQTASGLWVFCNVTSRTMSVTAVLAPRGSRHLGQDDSLPQGLSWARGPWALPTGCQEHLPLNCDNQELVLILPNVSWGEIACFEDPLTVLGAFLAVGFASETCCGWPMAGDRVGPGLAQRAGGPFRVRGKFKRETVASSWQAGDPSVINLVAGSLLVPCLFPGECIQAQSGLIWNVLWVLHTWLRSLIFSWLG